MQTQKKRIIPDIAAIEHPAIIKSYELEWLRRATYGLHAMTRVIAALSVAAVAAEDNEEVHGYLHEGLHMALVALTDELCGRIAKFAEDPPTPEDVAMLAYGWGREGIYRKHFAPETIPADC